MIENQKTEWDGYWDGNNQNLSKRLFSFMREHYFSKHIAKQLGDYNNRTVLEAGSGSCESLIYISKKAKKVVGLDNSAMAIEIGEENFREAKIEKEKYQMTFGNILDIPFLKNSFDIVFNSGVIEHFDSVQPIKEMIRVTKPQGRTIIFVPAKYSLYALFFRIIGISLKKTWDKHEFYTKAMMEKQLLDAGAEKIEVRHPASLLGVYIMGIAKKEGDTQC